MHLMNSKTMKLFPALAAAIALTLGACEKKKDPAAPTTSNTAHDDHDHDHDHDHVDDEHAHDDERSLGTVVADGYEVEALVSGDIKAGDEAHITVKIDGDNPKPTAVRAWIGAEDAAGAIKAKAESEEHGYHAHVETPATLGATDKLWIELEKPDGGTVAVSFAL